jgi:chromosome segregation ATPase
MSQVSLWLKKSLILALALALGLAALPLAQARAAGEAQDEIARTAGWQARRLARLWERQQRRYERAEGQFTLTGKVVEKSQNLIEKAREKDLDVTSLEEALAVYEGAVAEAQTLYDSGQAIINTHAGFDADGKVTDPAQARETIDALREVVRDTRDAVHDANQALRQAFRDFRQANLPK